MSLNQLLTNGVTTPCLPWKKIKVYDLDACNTIAAPNGDFDNIDVSTINGNPYPPGGGAIPALVSNKVLITTGVPAMQWGDIGPSNLTGGSVGDVLRTVAPGVVAWDGLEPGDIDPGTANQVLVTNGAGTATQWTSNVVVPGTFNVVGNTSVTTGDLTLFNGDLEIQSGGATIVGNLNNNFGATATFTNTNITGDLQFAGSGGVVGNVIKKTGAATQAWGDFNAADVKGGTLNQVLQSDGTSGVFNTNVTLPGNLTLNAPGNILTASTVNVTGKLRLAGLSATLGSVPVGNALNEQAWGFPQYFAQYFQNALVDMNGAATVLLLAGASAIVTDANITYLAGVFTLAEAGCYQIRFETIASTSAFKTIVQFRINGVLSGSTNNIYIPALTESQPLTLQKTFRLTAGSTVEIVSSPVVAGVINTSGAVSGVPTTLITIQRLSI